MASPIETNTEGLQEILQTVYNLPNAGGGSAEPDLVVGLTMPEGEVLDTGRLDIARSGLYIKSGSIVNTYEKLLSKQEVKVFLEHDYYYGAGGPFRGIFCPIIVTTFPTSAGSYLYLEFLATTWVGYSIKRLGIVYAMDGTVMDLFMDNLH